MDRIISSTLTKWIFSINLDMRKTCLVEEHMNDVTVLPKKTHSEAKKVELVVIDMIASNHSKEEIINVLIETYQYGYQTAHRKYRFIMDKIYKEHCTEKIEMIRYRKIKSLEKDIKEAYQNYLNSHDPDVKIKWYALYCKVKSELTLFYPNCLRPDEEVKEGGISVNIIPWTKEPDKE